MASMILPTPSTGIKLAFLLLACGCYMMLWQAIPESQLTNGYAGLERVSRRNTAENNPEEIYMYSPSKRITVGIVANEFMDPKVGRSGGFGMAASKVGVLLAERPEFGVDICFIFAKPSAGSDPKLLTDVHHSLLGWPMISMVPDSTEATQALHKANIDVLLLIDYRKDYVKVMDTLAETPVILWARDPRSRENAESLDGMRLPDAMNYSKIPQGVKAKNTTGALEIYKRLEGTKSKSDSRRKMVIGVVWMTALRERLYDAYGIPVTGNAFELPNSIVEGCGVDAKIKKSKTPAVIFVGRLDPYKRPWLMVDLARKFPKVEFWALGRQHFDGPGSYNITRDSGPMPKNIKLLGQVQGKEKFELLQKAWFLLSTSTHEGVAISYLEALQCRTPVLSTVDPGGLVSSYGIFAGNFNASGEQGLPALTEGFQQLLDDVELRNLLGDEGRDHVLQTHNPDRFLDGFRDLLGHLGFVRESHPVSIIVPSFSRMDTLPSILAHLLLFDCMQHPESEIIVAHVSEESWQERALIQTVTNQIIVSKNPRSSLQVGKLIHLDYVELNNKWGCTVRHIAALEASNDILIHLDDDLKPSNAAIEKMIWQVSEDPGFPNYDAASDFPSYFGPTLRYCGPNGYHHKKEPEILTEPAENQFILTNFAAMSSHLNLQFVSAFYENEFYELAMSKFRGNGCDLIFNHFYVSQKRPKRSNANVGGVWDNSMRPEEIEVTGYKGFYGGSTHKTIRSETCRCMFTDFTTDCLDKIPAGEGPKVY